MDISQQYIEMCNKATPLQQLKKYEDGDFVAYKVFSEADDDTYQWVAIPLGRHSISQLKSVLLLVELGDNGGDYEKFGTLTWVPRIDQLVDLVKAWVKIVRLDSIEERLLAFYMWEKHRQVWDKKEQLWK